MLGVGRYTASAICSIAYERETAPVIPVVDGNVCRVLARLRVVSTTIKTPAFKDQHAWSVAQTLVDNCRDIGSFNQAIMELGATYCAPHGTGEDPADPLRGLYMSNELQAQVTSYKTANKGTLADLMLHIDTSAVSSSGCPLCSASNRKDSLERMWEAAGSSSTSGHAGFPLPPAPKKQRQESYAVAVVRCKTKWWLRQRPETGLLAGQWEFPCIQLSNKRRKVNWYEELVRIFPQQELLWDRQLEEPVVHVFSHVVHTMYVATGSVAEEESMSKTPLSPGRWMTKTDMDKVGVTSGVRKVLQAVSTTSSSIPNTDTSGRNQITKKPRKK